MPSAAWLLPDLRPARATLASAGLQRPLVRRGAGLALRGRAARRPAAGSGWSPAWSPATPPAGATGPAAACRLRVRRLVLVACGAALAGGLAAPSYAVSASADRGARTSVDPGPAAPRPGHRDHARRPTGGPAGRRRHPAAARRARRRRTVVVRPGDTLWGLAATRSRPDAPDAAVTDRWQQIYRVNRAVIGADPDLIRPDQRLRLPPALRGVPMSPFHEKVVPLRSAGAGRPASRARSPSTCIPGTTRRTPPEASGRAGADVVPIDRHVRRPARAVVAPLRAGRRRDRRRRPAGHPAAALDGAERLRRPGPPGAARRPRRRPAGRARTGSSRCARRCSACTPASSPATPPRSAPTCATAERSRALAIRFELRGERWICVALEFA